MSSPRPVSTDSSRTNAVAPAGTSAPATERNAAPTLNERLENLPFTRAHGKLLGISGLGWALDAMDVGLISFVMAALIKEWHLSPTEASWLGSIGFAGMALGATFGGLLADKLGRRYIFALTLLIYGLATGASALATSLGVLLVFRFLVGLGLGAELPVASTLISEFSPRAIRGRVVVALEAFWALGWILAALIGTFVVPQANGWRWALAIGLIPAIYSLVIRMGTPESVRFLESVGKHDQARQVVERFEASPALFSRTKKQTEDASVHGAVESADNAESAKIHSIWAAGQRRKTIALCVIWFCINLSYYGAFIWIPALLNAQGFSLVKSFAFTLIMTLAQLPGYAVAAYLIEKWGRRATLATFLLGSALAAAGYGMAHSEVFIILAGCMLSFFNLGAWGALYALSPEIFPTHLRGTGTGAAAGIGRIASIAAPLIVPPLVAFGGTPLLFTLFSTAFLVAATTVFLLPERRGESL